MRIVTMDPAICVGCRNCEYACSFARSGGFVRKNAHIRVNVYPEERACIPMTCIHCDQAWCLEVCPAAAIRRDPASGAIVIDKERCAGCKMCMLACPYGNIHYDPATGICGKCDLCGGDPHCVKTCISGALAYEEADEAFAFRRAGFDIRLIGALRRERTGGGGIG